MLEPCTRGGRIGDKKWFRSWSIFQWRADEAPGALPDRAELSPLYPVQFPPGNRLETQAELRGVVLNVADIVDM